ncbi:hypothetical protein HMPREF0262_03160 [Clostridium sp. ATCC 29733]|nr:hypothetical protein HMPREF0262_03160 [Clostridium sp. ATCC 29733]
MWVGGADGETGRPVGGAVRTAAESRGQGSPGPFAGLQRVGRMSL